MKTNKKKTTRRREPMTLSQFKAWLNGIEDIQGDDWFPTEDQWKLIRYYINVLQPDETTVQDIEPVIKEAPQQSSLAGVLVPQQNNGFEPHIPEYMRATPLENSLFNGPQANGSVNSIVPMAQPQSPHVANIPGGGYATSFE